MKLHITTTGRVWSHADEARRTAFEYDARFDMDGFGSTPTLWFWDGRGRILGRVEFGRKYACWHSGSESGPKQKRPDLCKLAAAVWRGHAPLEPLLDLLMETIPESVDPITHILEAIRV